MLSHTRQTTQLTNDLRRFTGSLKASADNFKDAIEAIEQVFDGSLDLCRSPPLDGALGEAGPADEQRRLLTVEVAAADLRVTERTCADGFIASNPCRNVKRLLPALDEGSHADRKTCLIGPELSHGSHAVAQNGRISCLII